MSRGASLGHGRNENSVQIGVNQGLLPRYLACLKLIDGLGEVWSDDGLKLGNSAVAIGRANGANSAVAIPPLQHCAEYTVVTASLYGIRGLDSWWPRMSS